MPAHESPDVDKLCKVRLFLESLQADFTRCYNPHKEQATDEAIIKYKSRTSLKQYMPMKPIKCGIEVWCKADSHSNTCVTLTYILDAIMMVFRGGWTTLLSPAFAKEKRESGTMSTSTISSHHVLC